MAYILYFSFSISFTFGLWHHMLRHFYNEVMAVCAQLKSHDFYETKCAG